jgi:hypothetical protein
LENGWSGRNSAGLLYTNAVAALHKKLLLGRCFGRRCGHGARELVWQRGGDDGIHRLAARCDLDQDGTVQGHTFANAAREGKGHRAYGDGELDPLGERRSGRTPDKEIVTVFPTFVDGGAKGVDSLVSGEILRFDLLVAAGAREEEEWQGEAGDEFHLKTSKI